MLHRAALVLAMIVLASQADADGAFADRIAREVNASRKCETKAGTAVVECTYRFDGIVLGLVLDPREPKMNVFDVKSAPSPGARTSLKFGGLHACATISHMGANPGELAFVFISPKTGDVFTDWKVPACAR
jgi:hypothetical protein